MQEIFSVRVQRGPFSPTLTASAPHIMLRLGLPRDNTIRRWVNPATGIGGALCIAAAALYATSLLPRYPSLNSQPVAVRAAFPDRLPASVLWAWEEREDLRSINPEITGVAYLTETLRLDSRVTALPRHQPLMLPQGTRVMAVVRIEPQSGFRDTPQLRAETAERIAEAATPSITALQIDFDATLSQRAFYVDVLRQLRARLPREIPLSMTALLSWCSGDDWIAGLPVDEAVPMHFRMGLNTRDPLASGAWRKIEPKCDTSVGVSMDEPWPRIASGSRIYIFAPHPWTRSELAHATSLEALKTRTIPPPGKTTDSNDSVAMSDGGKQ